MQTSQRIRVLLVDDDECSAAAWAAVLQMQGFEVVWVPDGISALATARLVPPDLLITDWLMPGIDGPALCRLFRDDAVLARVPIILTSSLMWPSDRNGAPVLHSLFLRKPVDAAALLTAITTVVVVAYLPVVPQAGIESGNEEPLT